MLLTLSPRHDVVIPHPHLLQELFLVVEPSVVDPFPVCEVVEHGSFLVELGFLFGLELSGEDREVSLEILSVDLEHIVVPFEGAPEIVQPSLSVPSEDVVPAEDSTLSYWGFTAMTANWSKGLR